MFMKRDVEVEDDELVICKCQEMRENNGESLNRQDNAVILGMHIILFLYIDSHTTAVYLKMAFKFTKS